MATTDNPPRFESEFTVDFDFPAQYARAYVRDSMLQRPYIVRVMPIYIVLVVIVFLSQLALRGLLWGFVFGLPLGILVAVLIFCVSLLTTMRSTRRRIEHTVPEGSAFSLALDKKGFALSDVVGLHRFSYEGCSPARAGRHIVVLRGDSAGVATYVPAELFTPESLAYFSERVAAANPSRST